MTRHVICASRVRLFGKATGGCPAGSTGSCPGSAAWNIPGHALFAGDIIHTPLQLHYHGHDSCFCEDPAQARATRRRLLDWAADTTALILPAHFSGRSALEITRHADSYAVKQWAPSVDTDRRRGAFGADGMPRQAS